MIPPVGQGSLRRICDDKDCGRYIERAKNGERRTKEAFVAVIERHRHEVARRFPIAETPHERVEADWLEIPTDPLHLRLEYAYVHVQSGIPRLALRLRHDVVIAQNPRAPGQASVEPGDTQHAREFVSRSDKHGCSV